MVQGAEFDLKDIRFYTQTSDVDFVEDNEPIQDLNDNILTVDNKAILAKNTANTASSTLAAHIGGSGTSEHPIATDTVAGFMSTADKFKLEGIQPEAQLNILSPTDALELVGGAVTVLHTHITVTDLNDGIMTTALKAKLDTIQDGAEVNILSTAEADGLTGGTPDANFLHTHVTPTFTETFNSGDHSGVDHTGLLGVPSGFPGFTKVSFDTGPTQSGPGTTIFAKPFASFVSDLAVITAGIQRIVDTGPQWGASETFKINDVSKSGTTGTVVYEIKKGAGDGFTQMNCWIGGYGI